MQWGRIVKMNGDTVKEDWDGGVELMGRYDGGERKGDRKEERRKGTL